MARPVLRTRLCDILDIEYPVILAGMGGVATADLVAAVSEAGGLGIVGAASMPPDEIERQVRRIRDLTSKPFGVDVLLPSGVARPPQADAPKDKDAAPRTHAEEPARVPPRARTRVHPRRRAGVRPAGARRRTRTSRRDAAHRRRRLLEEAGRGDPRPQGAGVRGRARQPGAIRRSSSTRRARRSSASSAT